MRCFGTARRPSPTVHLLPRGRLPASAGDSLNSGRPFGIWTAVHITEQGHSDRRSCSPIAFPAWGFPSGPLRPTGMFRKASIPSSGIHRMDPTESSSLVFVAAPPGQSPGHASWRYFLYRRPSLRVSHEMRRPDSRHPRSGFALGTYNDLHTQGSNSGLLRLIRR